MRCPYHSGGLVYARISVNESGRRRERNGIGTPLFFFGGGNGVSFLDQRSIDVQRKSLWICGGVPSASLVYFIVPTYRQTVVGR